MLRNARQISIRFLNLSKPLLWRKKKYGMANRVDDLKTVVEKGRSGHTMSRLQVLAYLFILYIFFLTFGSYIQYPMQNPRTNLQDAGRQLSEKIENLSK